MDYINSHYRHEVHVHGPSGNFDFGQHSTSHIERVWNVLKENIRKVYTKIPNHDFILFLREEEMRYKFRNLSNIEKEKK